MANIYPIINEDGGTSYRVEMIKSIQDQLGVELESRAGSKKKYDRIINILDGLDTGCSLVGFVMGSVGAGLALTIIASPVSVILVALASGCALLSACLKIINRKLRLKAQKHAQICILAKSKLSSIIGIVSKALDDDKISDPEFQLVRAEKQKYEDLKKELQAATITVGKSIDEAFERGREQARQTLIKKIGAAGSLA